METGGNGNQTLDLTIPDSIDVTWVNNASWEANTSGNWIDYRSTPTVSPSHSSH